MRRTSLLRDLGVLGLRLVVGGLLAGHGTQKLFGWFGGHGIQGTGGFLESMGMRPGERYAFLAGAGELGSGALTALGFLWPAGPLGSIAPMLVATRTAHEGKPIWVSAGGAELPVVYMAVGGALALTNPGRFSLDRILGLKLHPALVALVAAAISAGTIFTLTTRQQPGQTPQPAAERQPETSQAPAPAPA